MRKVIAVGVVGGVLLLSAAFAQGAGSIEASTKFLLAWGKGHWDDLAAVAAARVTVTVGGKDAIIDVAGKKAEAVLVWAMYSDPAGAVRSGHESSGLRCFPEYPWTRERRDAA
jgi:hypothetical protein